MRSFSILSIGCGVLALSLMASFQPDPTDAATGETATVQPKGGKYIGQKMCKSCHAGAAKGDAHGIWAKSKHAGAYATLATDAAKAAAKELGIEEPQKSEKCLKCHVTAFGVDKGEIKGSFKIADGVQCESCHGPGETHQKKRMREAMKKGDPSPITADEITSGRDVAMCKQCHNEESPTYKPFCLKERMAKIEHLLPSKERSEEELKKLRNTCSPDCEICKKEEKKDGK